MSDRLLKESDVLKIAYRLSVILHSEFTKEVKALPSADRQQEWIPCSERLPELGEKVLVTCLMFDDYRDTGIYTRQWTSDHSEIRWFSDDEYGQLFDCDVVAWMPLPPAYKGADDE